MPPRKKRRIYTAEEKAAALRDYEVFGPNWVEKNRGIPSSTVHEWANKANVRTIRMDVMRDAHMHHQFDLKAARVVILENLYIDTLKEQAKYWDPSIITGQTKDGEPTYLQLSESLPIDRKTRMSIITSAVDRAVKLEAVDKDTGVNEVKSVLMDLAAAFGIGGGSDDNIDEELDGSSGGTDNDAEDATES